MKPTILTTQHIKPTHLHSHLLLPPHTGKHSKSKRECKQPHPFTADQTVKHRIQFSKYSTTTTLRTDRRAADNSTYPKVAASFFVGQFIVYLKCSSPNEVQW